MQGAGLSVWQFLPTGPTGFGNSPYQPLSVFAGNPLLIDLDELVEWGLLRPGEASLRLPGSAQRVDYDRVAAAKGPLLRQAAARFEALRDSVLTAEFDAFQAMNDAVWLDDFAAFAVLKQRNGERAWPEWPGTDRQHRPGLAAELTGDDREQFRTAKLMQFFFARQWSALRDEAHRRGIVLFGDVPIYMALDCAEAWARPELLLLDQDYRPIELAGVPPDYFSADGQLWGNPIYCWERHAAEGYSWWIARLRQALATADLVRLDHFRGFDAYWSVPQGASTAREGSWKSGPGAGLFEALAGALGRVPFVAEDLGMITDSVIALRRAYALPGMQVLQFLVDKPDFELAAIEEDCVCYTGTHDNDTTVGWFTGSDGRLAGAALEQLQQIVCQNLDNTEQSIYKAMIKLCFKSQARLAMAPLQDYLGLDSQARLNTPGQGEGNWLWRLEWPALEAADSRWIREAAATTGRL
jgi:4-alpha-glucanotransferase